MAATIVVAPERLRRAAVAIRTLGDRLLQVRGQLGATVAGLDPAFGGHGALTAFAELWGRWSASVERLAETATDLAAALEVASDGYERADQRSLPSPASPAAVALAGAASAFPGAAPPDATSAFPGAASARERP